MARVTAVMPTTEARREFWPKAAAYFLQQSYVDAELLILEEAKEPADLIQHYESFNDLVHNEWMPCSGLNTGQKRNLINSKVKSEIVIHWDDDDWYHPDRIAEQVRFLDESGKQLVGYRDLLYFRTTDRTLWAYYYQGSLPYCSGTSMCYRRQWWEAHPFKELSVSEDSQFLIEAATVGACASRHLSKFIVARSHTRNTYHIQFGQMPFIAATADMFPLEFLREVGL